MSSRRHLASVAEGTARAFASRNNDVGGWWAMALILNAVPPGDPVYHIDLLTGKAEPDTNAELGRLGAAWGRYLRWSMDRHGLPISSVRSAVLAVRFDRRRVVASWIPGGEDHPFTCTVTIDDDRGRRHQRVVEGHCSRLGDFVGPNPELRPRRAYVTRVPRVLERIEPAARSRQDPRDPEVGTRSGANLAAGKLPPRLRGFLRGGLAGAAIGVIVFYGVARAATFYGPLALYIAVLGGATGLILGAVYGGSRFQPPGAA